MTGNYSDGPCFMNPSMAYRILGRTGLCVSRIAFGAGPVSGLMTGQDYDRQQAVIEEVVRVGINWIDTAAGYGAGESERNLGRCLQGGSRASEVQIATKVRVDRTRSEAFADQIERSIEESLKRLGRSHVTLLQLHNGMTLQGDSEPFSVTPAEILGGGGIAGALLRLRTSGVVKAIGLTGTGEPVAIREVIRSGIFDTIQIPYNLLNPSAGTEVLEYPVDRNYGNVLQESTEQQMGGFAIRVFAGGALLGNSPSAHTLKTPFFPLSLYENDLSLSREIRRDLSKNEMAQESIRFSLAHPAIHSAIVGFATPGEVRNAVDSLR